MYNNIIGLENDENYKMITGTISVNFQVKLTISISFGVFTV